VEENKILANGKPLQVISYKDKIKEDGKWFEANCNFILSRSKFKTGTIASASTSGVRDLQTLYGVYNNKFPMEWFKHITDPLSAKDDKHKAFPAKIRPVTILRTNIDLLLAEYPRRPFIYQVNNLSDAGYNEFLEQQNKAVEQNLTEHFHKMLQLQLIDAGLLTQDGQPTSEDAAKQIQEELDNMQLPSDVKESFFASYKDKIAIQGQAWLRRAIQEHEIKQKFQKNFKHWLIVGESYSYKTVRFDNLVYEIVSPLDIDYVKSNDNDYIEDAEQIVRRRRLTISDVVDIYYPDLKKQDLLNLEQKAMLATPDAFLRHLESTHHRTEYIYVYHTTWKGKKEILFVMNLETGEEYQVDEDYKIDRNTEKITERVYVNEIYECTKIGDIYVQKRPILFQRNAMNNFSTCKQPYNGRRFSDMEAENLGPLELGIPFQIMYIIVTRTLELTIAKSKGKIFLIDQNVIPTDNGWTEEKFFYYMEGLGYALMNRNQLGVDKSFNQYQVLDMSLFDSIKQLIELQQHFKQEWDDVLGINRQRKGQTYASDAVGNNERATFQSTVITDMIFNNYEEFISRELQGILDLSKFTNISGVHKMWNDSELGNQILEIEPTQYSNAELGVFVQSSSEALQILKSMQNDAQAMLQNGAKPSTVLEVKRAQNIAELSAKLKKIEELQAQAEQAIAQNEQEAQKMADERAKDFAAYNSTLQTALMNAEYDRKEDVEMLKIEGDLYSFNAADEATPDGTPDILEIEKHKLEREKHRDSMMQQNADRAAQIKADVENRKLKREEIASKERNEKIKAKAKKTSTTK
jgi:hypothetical protein